MRDLPAREPRSVSVLVPVLDAAAYLDRQLEALTNLRYDGELEVVLADNGSVDGSLEIARRWATRCPNVRWVDASDRRGSGLARNAAAAVATGDLLAFCDADDEVDAGWMAGLVAAARTHDLVGGPLDTVALNDDLVRSWRAWDPPTDRLPVHMGFLPFVVGCNGAIWRDVFETVGGWNEGYVYETDVELSWRVQLASYRIGFAPDAVVRYRYRSSTQALARQAFRAGREDAHLHRDFRDRGLRSASWQEALRAWGSLGARCLDLAGPPVRRGRWLKEGARRSGRLTGSLRYRTLFL